MRELRRKILLLRSVFFALRFFPDRLNPVIRPEIGGQLSALSLASATFVVWYGVR
jgi:hypothetical protein